MASSSLPKPQHPVFGRRTALQAGAIGLLGLGMSDLAALRAAAAAPRHQKPKAPVSLRHLAISPGRQGAKAQPHDSSENKPPGHGGGRSWPCGRQVQKGKQPERSARRSERTVCLAAWHGWWKKHQPK